MDMKKMMKQAQKMQRDAEAAQQEINSTEFTATAGGGMVEAVVMGDNSIKSLKIDPEAIDPEDAEMLEDMVVAAINEALRNAQEASSSRMSSLMGGMKLPF